MMFSLEDVLREVYAGDTNEQGLPPGFRFHPSDEELITFYLASKVFNGSFCGVEIAEIDLNRCEPWELPDVAKMGEREWYFFSQRDRKYPTGLRTNRATVAGYWKATGKDKEVYCSSNATLLGMKKTLVFYKGRAPRGVKTKWVMHEYRLEGDFSSLSHMCNEEWVLCRILQKSGSEKKSPLFSSPSSFFPPTLESYPASFSEALHSPLSNFQPCYSPTTIINSNANPPLSYTMKQSTVPKQPKTESNFSFSEFQPFDANMYCLDRVEVQQNLWQDPLSFEMDCNTILGFSADTVHELSTSVGFDKTMLDDLPIIR